MPKKTKKEKIIAEYRHKLSTIHPYVYQTKTNTSQNTTAVVQPMDHAIRRDLLKTLILAAVAIVGEVVFSYII